MKLNFFFSRGSFTSTKLVSLISSFRAKSETVGANDAAAIDPSVLELKPFTGRQLDNGGVCRCLEHILYSAGLSVMPRSESAAGLLVSGESKRARRRRDDETSSSSRSLVVVVVDGVHNEAPGERNRCPLAPTC